MTENVFHHFEAAINDDSSHAGVTFLPRSRHHFL